ncbi:MAG: 16S rRNA (uracil(1498)-N(3))-methyltransferase [Clostridia bacterium]|nr:16S rRNA (uracil(1498)-N(3))-methyltransferase [Clostridia bacterium]
MPRFFADEYYPVSPLPSTIRLTGDDAFHLVRVLRARAGEKVTVVGGDGAVFNCCFESAGESDAGVSAILAVESAEKPEERPTRVTLLQGMPKGKKTDLVLQKATELGSDVIALVYMERSVPTPDKDEGRKAERFQRIVREAAEQSGRSSVPEVRVYRSLKEAMPLLTESEIAFACYEAEEERALPEILKRDGASIAFLIGPEGGLARREIELLQSASVPTVTLGRRILRTETAPLAVLSMILYEKELLP